MTEESLYTVTKGCCPKRNAEVIFLKRSQLYLEHGLSSLVLLFRNKIFLHICKMCSFKIYMKCKSQNYTVMGSM